MTNFFVFTHFYFIMYKLCINARSNEDLQAHSLQALENTRKTGKNYTIFTPKRYKSYCRRQKIEKLCTIYAENTQDNHDILYKNSYTLLFPLLRRLRSGFEPRRTHHQDPRKRSSLNAPCVRAMKKPFRVFFGQLPFSCNVPLPREWS